jgi:hypothetical protein
MSGRGRTVTRAARDRANRRDPSSTATRRVTPPARRGARHGSMNCPPGRPSAATTPSARQPRPCCCSRTTRPARTPGATLPTILTIDRTNTQLGKDANATGRPATERGADAARVNDRAGIPIHDGEPTDGAADAPALANALTNTASTMTTTRFGLRPRMHETNLTIGFSASLPVTAPPVQSTRSCNISRSRDLTAYRGHRW